MAKMINKDSKSLFTRTYVAFLSLISLFSLSIPNPAAAQCNDTHIHSIERNGMPEEISCCMFGRRDACVWVSANPSASVSQRVEPSGVVISLQSPGQYYCLNTNNGVRQDDILALYEDNDENCALCMSANACTMETEIRLSITRFFSQNILHAPCELKQNGCNLMFIHLNTCVRMTDSDFDPTANHSVVCPICRNFIHHITYEIPVNTFVDLNSCSVDTEFCSEIASTIVSPSATSSPSTASVSSLPTDTDISTVTVTSMLQSSPTSLGSTPLPSQVASIQGGNNTTGLIIGVGFGAVLVMGIILVAVICLIICCKSYRGEHGSYILNRSTHNQENGGTNQDEMMMAEMLPVFTVQPMDITIHLSDTTISVELFCEVDYALSYQWEKQNGDIPPDAKENNNTLIIENLLPTHGGKYRCVASNENGNKPSNFATLTVLGTLPIFTVHPMDITIHLCDATSVKLFCEANDALSYQWEKENSDIPPDAKENNNTLIIENLLPTHGGKYRCVASNENGNKHSNYATLTVLENTEPITIIILSDESNKCLMDVINSLYPEMEDLIRMNILYAYLVAFKVLTKVEYEKLGPQSKDSPTEKNQFFLSQLDNKGPPGQEMFVKALYRTKQYDNHHQLIELLRSKGLTITP